jgi:hypothetical protein
MFAGSNVSFVRVFCKVWESGLGMVIQIHPTYKAKFTYYTVAISKPYNQRQCCYKFCLVELYFVIVFVISFLLTTLYSYIKRARRPQFQKNCIFIGGFRGGGPGPPFLPKIYH